MEKINLEMCSYGQLSEVQMLHDLDLDLGWGQGHINRTSSLLNHVTVTSRSTKIWPSEFCEISTLDEAWTFVIAFLEGNSTRNPRKGADSHHCQHARLRQFSEVQKPRYLDLDLGLGQGHISMHNTCSSTSTCNHLTVTSRSWISWNIDIPGGMNCCDSFSRRKFQNRAPTSCSPGPILLSTTISFELHAKTAKEIDLEKYYFRNFRSSVTLTLTLDRVAVTLVCIFGRGHINIHTRNQIKIRKNFSWTYGWTDTLQFQSGNDLKMRLRWAVLQVPYNHHQPSVLSSTPKRWR